MLWKLIRPLLFQLAPETAHHLAFSSLETVQSIESLRSFLRGRLSIEHESLKTKVFGLDFSNPVGLAAGFDKDARLLPIWHSLGFGFAEIGTVTPLPQPGNPQPRLFRFPHDKAIINRMGFNNEGAEAMRKRLLDLLSVGRWPAFPVGINLGKGKQTSLEKAMEDYSSLLDSFLDLGDYFVLNVSSPNTPGLRELQEKSKLDELFAAVQTKAQSRCKPHIRPILVKVAPDLELSQLDDVLELCAKHRLAGIIATNTTLSREGLSRASTETGGLSGRPLQKRSTEFIRYIHKKTEGKLPIIGVGGIFTAEDAFEKIRAGASLVQVYTGFVYEGPAMVRQINQGLIQLLEKNGFRSVAEAVGK
jgi:dihydroorotate dehydrogenase